MPLLTLCNWCCCTYVCACSSTVVLYVADVMHAASKCSLLVFSQQKCVSCKQVHQSMVSVWFVPSKG